MENPTNFLTHLECSKCAKTYNHKQPQNLCTSCGKPLFAQYDLQKVSQTWDKSALVERAATFWRYMELLPIINPAHTVSLGELMTPLIRTRHLAELLGLESLWVKDESPLPGGSFKARGLAMAVSKAKELGLTKLAIPSAGNAATALAIYAAAAGLEANIFMPVDTPAFNQNTCRMAGASVTLVDGLITDAGKIVAERKEEENWFDVSTLKEPYRVEGKKTMGLEIAEQFDWQLPDVIVYPTGGGTGIVGMWKGFQELEEIDWIDAKRPRMISVQAAGCAPIVKAWEAGKTNAEPWVNAHTIAAGLRVPQAVGDFLILDAIRGSGGTAIAVTDEEILDAMNILGTNEGILACPEGAATVAGLMKLVESGKVDKSERIVLFNTGGYQVDSHDQT